MLRLTERQRKLLVMLYAGGPELDTRRMAHVLQVRTAGDIRRTLYSMGLKGWVAHRTETAREAVGKARPSLLWRITHKGVCIIAGHEGYVPVVVRQGPPYGALYFGDPWDAPVTDDGTQVATPVGQRCYDCLETIGNGDQGFIRGGVDIDRNAVVTFIHRECDMLGIVGHMVGVCPCTSPTGTRREQGVEVLRRWAARSSG